MLPLPLDTPGLEPPPEVIPNFKATTSMIGDAYATLVICLAFSTTFVPGPCVEKDLLVAAAACSRSLGRAFDFGKDFIYIPKGKCSKRGPDATYSSTATIVILSLGQGFDTVLPRGRD